MLLPAPWKWLHRKKKIKHKNSKKNTSIINRDKTTSSWHQNRKECFARSNKCYSSCCSWYQHPRHILLHCAIGLSPLRSETLLRRKMPSLAVQHWSPAPQQSLLHPTCVTSQTLPYTRPNHRLRKCSRVWMRRTMCGTHSGSVNVTDLADSSKILCGWKPPSNFSTNGSVIWQFESPAADVNAKEYKPFSV